MWNTACLDHRERLLAGSSLVPDLPLFAAERDRALRIFKRLRLPDVIDQPTMGEACGEWCFDIVAAIFGAYDPDTNRRMIQELFLLVPKKNAKSTIAAGIMVTAMIVNKRPNAEFLLIAPTKEVAGIAYGQAKGMINADPELQKLFHLQDHVKTITHRASNAELKIKAADTDVITGSKSTGILVDETHVFAQKAKASDIFVEIRGALAARPDGFMIQITTQSKEPPAGVFKSELAIARSVRDGLIRLPRLAVLYELPVDLIKDNGWTKPKLWPLVNPNLGRSVDLQFLENALLAAQHDQDPKKALALLASQHFNVQIGLALRFDRWTGANYWPAAADKTLTLAELKRRCEVAVVGIDGGGLDDLLGLNVTGRCRETARWLSWSRAWAQSDVIDNRPENSETLADFIASGDLVVCQDPTQDIRDVADIVEDLNEAGLLPAAGAVGFDPQGVAAMVDEVAARGIEDDQVVAIPQGYKQANAIWGMERKLKNGTYLHDGSDMMTWCVGNAKIEERGNAVLITKQVAGRAKIDPLCAGFNAFQLMSRNPEARGGPELYVL